MQFFRGGKKARKRAKNNFKTYVKNILTKTPDFDILYTVEKKFTSGGAKE